MSSASHLQALPDTFAQGYASTMRERWIEPVGVAIRRMTPIAMPGAPPEAILGFTTESGSGPNAASDDTATDGSHNSFHEIGYFQTEAGLATGPAPNPDPAATYNAWGALAASPLVVRLLGRPATMVDGAWATAVDDQAAVGLANLVRHANATARNLPLALRPSGLGTLWNMVLAFMGFGAGDGGAAQTINRYASRIAVVPESARWGALIEAVIADAESGPLPGRPGRHGNPAFDVLRVWDKLATGRLLATSTGGNVGWFDPQLTMNATVAQRAIVDAAWGGSGGGTGAALTVGLLAVGGSALYRWATGNWPWEHFV